MTKDPTCAIFDILEPSAFQKYSTCWVFSELVFVFVFVFVFVVFVFVFVFVVFVVVVVDGVWQVNGGGTPSLGRWSNARNERQWRRDTQTATL